MKKALSVLLVLLLVSFAAFAGGSKETAAAASADDPYAGLGNYTMMIGHSQPADNPRSISLEKFVADVEEKTNGHVTVQVFGNGQLGTEKEMLEQNTAGYERRSVRLHSASSYVHTSVPCTDKRGSNSASS